MYPYFQKSFSLQAAEKNIDPIQKFLLQNPAFGTLIFQVSGGQGAYPVPNATVTITKELDDRLSLSANILTDESGKTEPISLPAPSRELSQSPGNDIVYSVYQAEITAEGYVPVKIHDLPVFDGITTIQPVRLSPDFGQPAPEPEEIEDKEPDL